MDRFNLLSQVDHRFIGLIWLSGKPLSLYTDMGQAMNYLTDGLLGESYQHHHAYPGNEFICIGKQYGSPLFICHKEVKGSLSTKIENFDTLKRLVSQARKNQPNLASYHIGIICDDTQINPEPLMSQCAETLSKTTIQILNTSL